jgi:two-component system sensor histidine kinase GlrK
MDASNTAKSKKRRFIYPRSYVELMAIGFSLVALPLLVAFITGVFYVSKLTEQSQEALYRAVQSTQATSQLVDTLGGIERSSRQYFILGDQQFYLALVDRHSNYQSLSEKLDSLLLDQELRQRLHELDEKERALFARMRAMIEDGDKTIRVKGAEFAELTELGRSLFRDSNRLIDSEMQILQDIASKAESIIFWELSALIPGVLIFIFVFIVLLSKPIRQLDQGIRQIGDGQLENQIEVNGAQDLVHLGERLDWLRTRLKYLEDKKTKFLHYVSHELKTPLAAVREGSELLAEGVAGPLNEHQQEVSEILRKNTINLQRMIEKMLSFNLPGDASENDGFKPLFLPLLLETVIADHKPVILSKNLELKLQCKDVMIDGIEEQLRVVMDNLISNAVKFAPEGGWVEVKLGQQDGDIMLTVEDSGAGISDNDAAHIFDAFYQGSQTGQGTIRGSGLGLAIVKEFVEAHGGSVGLNGAEPGKGAMFWVRLPTSLKEEDLACA